jgi:hypothetical protein
MPGAVVAAAEPRNGAGPKARNTDWLGKRTATVLLDDDLYERLTVVALDTGPTVQALTVEGEEMVIAHLQERHPRKVG